jgi:hypothetical protein
MKTVGPPYSGKLNVRWDGKGMGGNHDRASEALQQGKPAVTDRRGLPSLSHSFTLDFIVLSNGKKEQVEALREELYQFLKETVTRFKARI